MDGSPHIYKSPLCPEPDGLPYEFYKYAGQSCLPLLSHLSNTHQKLNDFAEGNLILLPKKGDNQYNIYRPIVLQNTDTCHAL